MALYRCISIPGAVWTETAWQQWTLGYVNVWRADDTTRKSFQERVMDRCAATVYIAGNAVPGVLDGAKLANSRITAATL